MIVYPRNTIGKKQNKKIGLLNVIGASQNHINGKGRNGITRIRDFECAVSRFHGIRIGAVNCGDFRAAHADLCPLSGGDTGLRDEDFGKDIEIAVKIGVERVLTEVIDSVRTAAQTAWCFLHGMVRICRDIIRTVCTEPE